MLLSMKETILVVGGGIAGMETAVQLKALGLTPVIVEKNSSLGGHVAQWNRLFPDMTPASKVLEPYKDALKEVDIYTDTEIASINSLQKEYAAVLSNGKTLRCKAVVFATGFKLFEAEKKEEYGYGIYDRVITNRDLERWFDTRSDERVPAKPAAIGFVHCVGSRDVKAGNSQCSKVCCITAIKQAIEMKELFPDIDGRVQVKAEDTLSGKPVKVKLDLLVLMSGIVCDRANNELARSVSLPLDEDGFFRSLDNIAGVTCTDRKGLFLAGTCTGPKTVPETLAEARSAALQVYQYLKAKKK